MCGRFTLRQTTGAIAEAFQLAEMPDLLTPRYNIAPTQTVIALVQETSGSEKQLRWMRWGLIPSWSKDVKIGNRTDISRFGGHLLAGVPPVVQSVRRGNLQNRVLLINARAETLAEKPSFRNAFKHRRCLIVADGFYEWQKTGNSKQPYYFQLQDEQLFAFAGLWESWQPEEGEAIVSCTLITTEANDLMEKIHDRMPVILPPDTYDRWLDPIVTRTDALQPLLKPYNSEGMKAFPVSSTVNSPSHNQPDCVEPLSC